jgi:hypothetical protein
MPLWQCIAAEAGCNWYLHDIKIYQRLKALAMALTKFVCKDNDDEYVKRMFIASIIPKEPIQSETILSRPDFEKLTSNEVLCEFTTLTTLKKNVEAIPARVLASQGAQNIALKTKVVHKQEEQEEEKLCKEKYWSPEYAKYALDEHLALTTNAFWDANKHKFKGLMTHKYRGSQQSSREVKPKFIDLTQGEPKNIYKP